MTQFDMYCGICHSPAHSGACQDAVFAPLPYTGTIHYCERCGQQGRHNSATGCPQPFSMLKPVVTVTLPPGQVTPEALAWAVAGATRVCPGCSEDCVCRKPGSSKGCELCAQDQHPTGRVYVLPDAVRVECNGGHEIPYPELREETRGMTPPQTLRPIFCADAGCLGWTPAGSLETWLDAALENYKISLHIELGGRGIVCELRPLYLTLEWVSCGAVGLSLRDVLLAALKQALVASGATLYESEPHVL